MKSAKSSVSKRSIRGNDVLTIQSERVWSPGMMGGLHHALKQDRDDIWAWSGADPLSTITMLGIDTLLRVASIPPRLEGQRKKKGDWCS
jgi:hypothetical protein